MFEKDCHSFYMEDGLVRAKWKQEEYCPGVQDERVLQKKARKQRWRGDEKMKGTFGAAKTW